MENKKMAVLDVQIALAHIRSEAGDDESQHSLEDVLYENVLRSIAAGNPLAADLAKEALKSKGMDFARHCA